MSVYIIAELGVNHNGSLELALELIDAAAQAGANAVKVQTFIADQLASTSAPKADYQLKTTSPHESQHTLLKSLELKYNFHPILKAAAEAKKLDFFSSPFDLDSIEFLYSLQLPYLKIPSGELTNAPYLLAAARTKIPLIISTGMATLEEIRQALAVIHYGLQYSSGWPANNWISRWHPKTMGVSNKITLLHCTTEYPAPLAHLNLKAISLLQTTFDLPVGYSDHTSDLIAPVIAVTLGATMIEKHLTLDRSLAGPDHAASLNPKQFNRMVHHIRQTQQALGLKEKKPSDNEKKNAKLVRKSLVAAKNIHIGEIFSPENITIKRPGFGISPMHYWHYLGRSADRDYIEGELIMKFSSQAPS